MQTVILVSIGVGLVWVFVHLGVLVRNRGVDYMVRSGDWIMSLAIGTSATLATFFAIVFIAGFLALI